MDANTLSPNCLAAFVDEGGGYDHVSRVGIDLARRQQARLLLYDSTSASAFREPVAGELSAEGVGEDVPPLLSPQELETQGHHPLAEKVAKARSAGVDAWGRLASEHGAGPFLEFADTQHADLLLVPAELDDPGIVERLRGETVDDTRSGTSARVVAVDRSGRLG
jgi:hypothetical protein